MSPYPRPLTQSGSPGLLLTWRLCCGALAPFLHLPFSPIAAPHQLWMRMLSSSRARCAWVCCSILYTPRRCTASSTLPTAMRPYRSPPAPRIAGGPWSSPYGARSSIVSPWLSRRRAVHRWRHLYALALREARWTRRMSGCQRASIFSRREMVPSR